MAGRHLALVIVSPDALWRLFLQPGEHRPFRIGNVPPDARLVRVYHQPAMNGVCFELEHEAFPECQPLTSPIVLDPTIEFLGVDEMFLEAAATAGAPWLSVNDAPPPRSRRRVTLEGQEDQPSGFEVDGVMVPHAYARGRQWLDARRINDGSDPFHTVNTRELAALIDPPEATGPISALFPPGPGTLIEQAERELIRQGMPPTEGTPPTAPDEPERYECGEACGGYFTLTEWGDIMRDGRRRCPGCGVLTVCSYDDPPF